MIPILLPFFSSSSSSSFSSYSLRREWLERKLLHIFWFIIRNNRGNLGETLLFISGNIRDIFILWQSSLLSNLTYVIIFMEINNTIDMTFFEVGDSRPYEFYDEESRFRVPLEVCEVLEAT